MAIRLFGSIRSRLLSALLLLLAIVLMPLPLAAQNLCAGLVQDKTARPMTALAKPPLLGTVVDPQFGTTIRRISAVAATGSNPAIKPMYSTISAWNADESYLILFQVDPGQHLLYNGRTYQFIRVLDINPADIEQVYWHTTDPDILFYVDAKTLIRYHVSTGVKEAVRLFEFCSSSATGGDDPMFMSWDSNRIGLTCGSQVFIYDIATNTVTGNKALNQNPAQMAPTGTLAYLSDTGYVTDPALNNLRKLDLKEPFGHASLGLLSNGHDTWNGAVYDDGPAGNTDIGILVTWDLTNATSRVIVGPKTGWPYPDDGHISMLAYKRPGWGVVSTQGGTSGAKLLDREMLLADTNSGTVCRIGRTRTWGKNNTKLATPYWAEAHAVPSPSGTRVLFGSDWGNGTTVDAYVVELPGYTGGGGSDGDLSVSLTPSASSVAQGAAVTYSANVLNGGSTSIPTVTLSDTLPAGLSFASATSGCTAAGQVVTCALGSLAGGASRTVTITATAISVGNVTNRVDVTGSVSDPNTSNNSASVVTAIVPTLSINDVTLSEGNSGTKLAQFTVSLSAGSASTITVNYATANGTATAGSDYVAKTGTLSFSPGSLQATIDVTVNGDTTVEPDETFLVNLTAPSGAIIADGQGLGTITNDDAGSLPALSINDVAVIEGNSGTVNARFTVTLSAASASTVTVNYATADATATAGSDYVARAGTLSFPAGTTSQFIDVTVNGDTTVEPNETFLVNLTAPSGATLADGQGVGTILNDDSASLPTLSINNVTVTEGNSGTQTAQLVVSLSAISSTTVTVKYATVAKTAHAGSDFDSTSGTLSFSPGSLQRTVNVKIIGDRRVEPDEYLLVRLSNPVGAILGSADRGRITIKNND